MEPFRSRDREHGNRGNMLRELSVTRSSDDCVVIQETRYLEVLEDAMRSRRRPRAPRKEI
jgi:hypothetical protein